MSEGYTSPLSFMFFIKEIGHGKGSTGGTVAVPVKPAASDVHIPFNPIKGIKFTIPLHTEIQEIILGDVIESVFSPGNMENGKMSISDAHYHAPFLLAKIFPKKVIGTWVDDAHATIAMTSALADFVTEPESMAIHVHIDDKKASPNDIDVNLYGCAVEEYEWAFKTDDILRENAEIVITNVDEGAIAFNTAADYHNGAFALWNNLWITNDRVRGIPFSALTISTYTNLDAAIRVTGGKFRIKLPRKFNTYIKSDASSGKVESAPRTVAEFEIELDVTVVNKEIFSQSLLEFKNRTDATPKIMWTSGAFSEYIQCTNMRISPDGEFELPEAKDLEYKTTLKFKADGNRSVLSFAGTYDQSETAVPTNYV